MVKEKIVRIGEGPEFDYQGIAQCFIMEEKDLVERDIQLTVIITPSATDFGRSFETNRFNIDEGHFITIQVFGQKENPRITSIKEEIKQHSDSIAALKQQIEVEKAAAPMEELGG